MAARQERVHGEDQGGREDGVGVSARARPGGGAKFIADTGTQLDWRVPLWGGRGMEVFGLTLDVEMTIWPPSGEPVVLTHAGYSRSWSRTTLDQGEESEDFEEIVHVWGFTCTLGAPVIGPCSESVRKVWGSQSRMGRSGRWTSSGITPTTRNRRPAISCATRAARSVSARGHGIPDPDTGDRAESDRDRFDPTVR